MKKTTKGALAASTAAVLLLGGAGSLAYWNTEGTVEGGGFSTGDLELDFANCDTAGWTVTNSIEGVSDQDVDLTDFAVVPGDVFTKACTIAVVAVGDNIRATLGVTDGSVTPSATLDDDDYTVTSSFLLAGAALTEVDESNNGNDIAVELTVDFPIGNTVDNDSKNSSLDLGEFTVAATQATAPATP